MRAVIQRVTSAILKVDGKLISQIKQGLVVLVGISTEDTFKDANYIAEKIPKLRIFEDENEKMNLSVLDVDGEVLLISNFTLYGETKGTNRPSFTNSAKFTDAEPIYNYLARILAEKVPTKEGVFGGDMKIEINADGPVTIVMDSYV